MRKIAGTRTNYDKLLNPRKRSESLTVALDIRKFEIELYWRRAAYFWTFIAATFAAYFLLYADIESNAPLLFVISCIGVSFSVAWYLANRGSKFWTSNWETHVDYLEDEQIGPLYKTVTHPSNYSFWKPLNAYPYSVSKINQILNLYVVLIWLYFAANSFLLNVKGGITSDVYSSVIIGTSTVIFIALMFIFARSNLESRRSMTFGQRTPAGNGSNSDDNE